MKDLIRVISLIGLAAIPMAVFAQSDANAKHAINTKGAGGDRALPSCGAIDAETEGEVQMALKTRTKSNNTNERTKTKSNNANDRASSPVHKTVEPTCLAKVTAEQAKLLVFTWMKDAYDSHRLRVWQLKSGQNNVNGKTAENLLLEDTANNSHLLIVDNFVRRPRDVSTSFVWEVQAIDATGNPVGPPQSGAFELVP